MTGERSVNEAEVLIVGAGITGLCAALELVRRGREVVVVERREIGAGASGNNAGSCAVQNKPRPLITLARESVQIWGALQENLQTEGLDLGYVRSGGLRLAETQEQVEELELSVDAQRALGVSVQFLSGREAREAAPYLGESVQAANWCPDDGFCDVLHSMAVLPVAVRRHGGAIVTHTEVTAIERVGSSLHVRTSRGSWRAGRVLICAGTWTRDLERTLGVSVPLEPKINILSVTARTAPVVAHMLTHVSHRLTMKQFKIGTVMIGGGWPGVGDYRTYQARPTFESLRGNWQMAVRAVPALAQLNILRSWGGIDGRSPDGLPLVGPVPGLSGAYMAACCPAGWTTGPFIAQQLVEMAETGRVPPVMAPFDPARYNPLRQLT